MKKKLRVIPLATAAFLAMGMSAVSAKTIYFATDRDAANFIKADAAGLKANPEYLAKYREAQNKGWKIVVEDNGKTIDWAKALDQKVDYSKAVENSASYQGQAPAENKVGKEVKPDGKVEDKTPPIVDPAVKAAEDAVAKAEQTKTQADKDAAQALVDKLPAGAKKTELQNRLNNIQVGTTTNKDILKTAVESATFGAKITVSVDVKGEADYPNAKKYQVFDGESPISAVVALGSPTTIYPAKVTGDQVTIKLLAEDGITVVLSKEVSIGTDVEIGEGNVPTPTDQADDVKAAVEPATFGAKVTVLVDVKGEADYPNAKKYQVFDGELPISAVVALGSPTTIYPKKEKGNQVAIKLFAEDGTTVIATKTVELQ